MPHPRFSLFAYLLAALCLLGDAACVSMDRSRRIPKRSDFAVPLDSLRSNYPVLSFPPKQGGGSTGVGKGQAGLRQSPILEASLLFKVWGAPNVAPEEAGFPPAVSQGSVVWVWQFYDKRVIARGQVWPIRKSKPYVEKIEVQGIRQPEGGR